MNDNNRFNLIKPLAQLVLSNAGFINKPL